MINNLEVALALNQRHKVSDFVVSESVFRTVVERCHQEDNYDYISLNAGYGGRRFCFENRAVWRGILFIFLSDRLYEEAERVPNF